MFYVSLSHRVAAVTVERVKWKPLELLFTAKRVRQKQYCMPGGIPEIGDTIKYLKGVEM